MCCWKNLKKVLISISLLLTCTNVFATNDLMVYTSRNEHLVRDIFRQYKEETGINVRYRTGDPGQLIQTLLSEGENTSADIYMTVDAGNLWYAAEQGLLAEVNSPILEKNIPAHLKDADNQWFGLSVRARTIVYNTNNVNPSELSSYENLADETWKGRLCLRTSRKVYNQSLTAMFIHEHGREKAKEILSGWVKNHVEIFSNDTSVLRAVAAGQCDLGIVNSYYYGRLLNDSPDLPIKLFWPNQSEDDYGVHVNVSGAGVVENSKNKEAAIKFLEWLSSSKAQTQFAQVNLEYSVNDEVSQAEQVQDWGSFRQNSSFNLSMAGKLQRDAIRLMHEVGYN